LFVKGGTLLPLSKPVEHITADTVFDVTVYAFGLKPADFTLYEDDGISDAFKSGEQNTVRLHWDAEGHAVKRAGQYKGLPRIEVVDWKGVDSF
jgi:alpha-D-xyloside xylohydrolase